MDNGDDYEYRGPDDGPKPIHRGRSRHLEGGICRMLEQGLVSAAFMEAQNQEGGLVLAAKVAICKMMAGIDKHRACPEPNLRQAQALASRWLITYLLPWKHLGWVLREPYED